ncbi:putative bifunctional diguanylate cyclase/phosphodiesterase [Catenovulum maritimum]|uniref:EAL domain-containing protein n=1 Tax=Catenovulum maritimum TaxID=1513271 RepID=A0A0J8GYD4_9ALTE|nr:GGDEF domain-containing phosphodiesterase [Catenovulum maritimum]KMT66249.1 hypothetical protein XM47_04445 [Catenovulum maritimum]
MTSLIKSSKSFLKYLFLPLITLLTSFPALSQVDSLTDSLNLISVIFIPCLLLALGFSLIVLRKISAPTAILFSIFIGVTCLLNLSQSIDTQIYLTQVLFPLGLISLFACLLGLNKLDKKWRWLAISLLLVPTFFALNQFLALSSNFAANLINIALAVCFASFCLIKIKDSLIFTSALMLVLSSIFIEFKLHIDFDLVSILANLSAILLFFKFSQQCLESCSFNLGTAAKNTAASNIESEYINPVTGLANKNTLALSFKSNILSSQDTYALVVLKIEDLSSINQLLGFATGDTILIQTGLRINQKLTEIAEIPVLEQSRDELKLAHISGVRFAFWLNITKDRDLPNKIAVKIMQVLPEPIPYESIIISLSTSLGYAVYPNHGEDFESLFYKANLALTNNPNPHLINPFNLEYDLINKQQKSLAAQLPDAINKEQLELVAQPILNLSSKEIVSVEALIRWRHPSKGLIAPAEFINIAENTGLIHSISKWVIETGLAEVSKWQQASLNLSISINISSKDLLQHEFVDYIAEQLVLFNLPSSSLILEITESVIANNPEQSHAVIQRLDQMGIAVYLDDFGSGFTSLASLRNLAIAGLKIDQSFIANLTTSNRDNTIVTSIIDLARNLGFKIIAEGIEAEAIESRLIALECDYAQGFLYSKPIELHGFINWAKTWQPKQNVI